MVVDHLRGLSESPSLVVVDTLHRFLAGDENSSQDAREMLTACSTLMSEFSCSVVLVHHTGVSEEAQHRARGSSAWRGALDIEISVIPKKGGEKGVEIVQRKSKDAETAEPVSLDLQQVEIAGWLDEDGEPVSSCVMVAGMPAETPIERKKETELSKKFQDFSRAWDKSGQEIRDEKPFVSRSAMREYLVNNRGLAESTANKWMKSSTDNLIGYLIKNEVIEYVDKYSGWTVVDSVNASVLMVRKNCDRTL